MTRTTTPQDTALAAAIAAAADCLRFNHTPGGMQRVATLALFVALLADRLALGFPASAGALRALVESPATPGNPAALSLHHQQQQ
ncbi:hypothetical protein [Burkholderia territorii]|uniref:hypothetical protein n=1 Tax=Burkholderia territorii TaxID=1503055 RepID=UPI0007561763|nr:hypothetical protein [Burkholderia territorii]KVQ57519.1 hypothetical protein WT23_28400 [Burkholderia territorii]